MSAGTMPGTKAVGTRVKAQDVSMPYAILKALGSLKITVTMFALGTLIVFFGTLAQDELDLTQVKREYFTCWIASIPFDVLVPVTLFPHSEPILGGFGIYFPGGATIGLVLLINLIAAKTTRFSVRSSGLKLAAGTIIALLGAALVVAVIVSGHSSDGLQGKPPISYDTLWLMLKGGFGLLTVAMVAYAIMAKLPGMAKSFVWLAAVSSLILSVMLFSGGESVRLDDPGLRIVWQLLQATIASSVVLLGLWLVFGKTGGNVLIHVGVGLLMVGQFVFGDRQIEQRIGLAEGTSTNLAIVESEIEIALVDTSDPNQDLVYAIPEQLIVRASKSGEIISSDELPVDLKIVDWMRNSNIAPLAPRFENPATAGFGMQAMALEAAPQGGAISDSINISAAYVQLLDKQSGEPIETVLLSQERNDIAQMTAAMQTDQYEPVEIDGKPFELAIRFRQERKPYEVLLKDVERINYSGTDTPRDYSSKIVITERNSGETQEGKTWMNNPIRYKGETFYQSRYNKIPLPGGQTIETTGLQVVENAGWVIPYIACMMVFVGMFAHFGGTFLAFASRYSRGAIPTSTEQKPATQSLAGRIVIAGSALGFTALIAGYFAFSGSSNRTEVDWKAIGQLPVQHEGRIKPFDTAARNILQLISKPVFGSVPYVKDEAGEKRAPVEWLLGVMADKPWVKKAEVFRIYSPEARDFFELDPRTGSRYAYSELEPKLDEFRAEIGKLRNRDPDSFSRREQKLAELHTQLNEYDLVNFSYRLPPLPMPPEESTKETQDKFLSEVMQVFDMMQRLESGDPPAVIPPQGDVSEKSLVDAKWQAYGPAVFASFLGARLGMSSNGPNPAVLAFSDLLDAVRSGSSREINAAVDDYRDLLGETPLAAIRMNKASAERWLNQFNPTAQGVLIYILAILCGFVGFLVRWDGIRRATFWLLVGVFVIHTIALISRIYISGRAPVINLYSSAVFIGWACVLLSLFLEAIYPIGIANLVAGLTGVASLSVARFLDTSDTMPVLQAVLDTQFWLSTHVITVTAGYAVTFLAGFLGACALVHRIATRYDSTDPKLLRKETVDFQKILYRMTYGVVCFAIFFSFIGTVLGGLWADDSWGRFWGWDPKENGALMIVLWNAILLHARWDKMVGPRGFAVLAVLGNIITAWSWFGTNQLGIGLHSYGFTSGILVALGLFAGVNLLFALVGFFLTRSSNNQLGDGAA